MMDDRVCRIKILRLIAALVISLGILTACSLPLAENPGTTEGVAPASSAEVTLTRTPHPPTATSIPEVWFIDVQDGDTVTAGMYPENRLPMISLQIGFTPNTGYTATYLALDADGMQVTRVKYDYLDQITNTTFNWTAWHGNGAYRLDLNKIDYKGRVISSQTVNITVTGIPDDVPTVEERFRAAYLQSFGLHLDFPVFAHFNDENPERSMWNRWYSTAYIGDTFYTVYFYDESDVTGTNTRSLVSGEHGFCRPAGDYSILVVVVDYGNTSIDHEKVLEKLTATEEIANQRWSDYSASIGLTTPILHTETTQVYLDAPPVPGEELTIEQVKALTGYDPADFDILAEVDLDLEMQGPEKYGPFLGAALLGACQPGGARKVNIIASIDRPENVTKITNVVYDHELIHLFGWEHEWPNGDGNSAAQINENHWFPYKLFGWTDTDGDGVIEILSDHPYGLKP
jgi:hypothetical protein